MNENKECEKKDEKRWKKLSGRGRKKMKDKWENGAIWCIALNGILFS
jgi:hypothetical protein